MAPTNILTIQRTRGRASERPRAPCDRLILAALSAFSQPLALSCYGESMEHRTRDADVRFGSSSARRYGSGPLPLSVEERRASPFSCIRHPVPTAARVAPVPVGVSMDSGAGNSRSARLPSGATACRSDGRRRGCRLMGEQAAAIACK